MNRRALLLWLGLALLTGCARHYTITLRNGMQIPTNSKPRLEGGSYHYKDTAGGETSIPAGRVLEIAPSSGAKEESAPIKSRPPK